MLDNIYYILALKLLKNHTFGAKRSRVCNILSKDIKDVITKND